MKFLELAGVATRIGRQSPTHRGSGPARSSKPLEANSLSETISATAPRQSIRTTRRIVIIIVGILIVAMWAVVGAAINKSRETALANAHGETKNLAAAFVDQVTHILDGVAADMDVVAGRMRDGRALKDVFRDIPLRQVATIQGAVLAPDGMLAATTLDPNPKPLDLSDREHFRVHLDGHVKGIFIGKPVTGRVSKEVTIQLTRRVDGEDGRFLGVILFSVLPANLTGLTKSIDLGPNGALALAGTDNVIRARFTREHPDGLAGVGHSITGDRRPSAIPENGHGDFIVHSTFDHVTRVFSYRRLTNYPLVVYVGLGRDEVLAGWRSSVAMIVGLALGTTLLLISLTIYLIRHMDRAARAARAEALKITHMAEHDFLTGLPNRMLLNDRIGQAIAAAQRRKNNVAVLFLDLDGFKKVNDSLGHPIGDKLLQAVANRLVACVRGSDTVCRQGGDEFVVLLSEVQRPDDAGIAAQKMLEAVAEIHSIDQHELRITTSIGVSIYPQDGLDARTLVKNADIAMYQAKESGRQCYRFFTPATNVQASEGQFTKRDLRLAS